MSTDAAEPDLSVRPPKSKAAGVKGVAVALSRALEEMGPTRTVRTLTRLNQTDGFDCMSCAWPDPDPEHRHKAEFCENGAKAVAEEATKARVGAEFFAKHSIRDLDGRDEYWLGKQGRLTQPMVKWPGGTHYEPLDWDRAYGLIATHISALDDPNQAVFYTSGRASNEAAFLYQLFARQLGTNNLPDCSNMCHESTGVALIDSIGIGKGSVHLHDLYQANLIVLVGQNPGTNHPRMLSALERAKNNGARILTINPLREAGSTNFRNPQRPRGVIGHGTDLTDLHLPVKINGDLALFRAIASLLLEWGGTDTEFIRTYTRGFDEWKVQVEAVDWDEVKRLTGLSLEQITGAARMIFESSATVYCWAMGLTQHRNSVATIREVVNVALMRGDIGRPGAGLCPVRGHSNVQGDRTMGIWEKPPEDFLLNLDREFRFEAPRRHGFDTVEAIQAFRDGRASVFVALGGNFVAAAPDTEVTRAAMSKARLTVQISTKLNRSHLACGETALILPTLGRTEQDLQASGPQFITVEDSMSVVHASRGRLSPAAESLQSEVAIVTRIAEATLGANIGGASTWEEMRNDYSLIRHHISRVVPGFEGYEERVLNPGGFTLPHPPRDDRTFPTRSGKAEFGATAMSGFEVPAGFLALQTLRSHDQFNTTIYGLSDRYRGVEGGRRVVFVSPADLKELGLVDGMLVDLVAHWPGDAIERRVNRFRVVQYATPLGSAAAYYPEVNPLVPLGSTAVDSNTPTSKSVLIKLVPSTP